MYNGNVAGTGNKNCGNGNVAGDSSRRKCGCNNNVGGDFDRRKCDFVFECLAELLDEVLGERGHKKCDCEFVFECLEELLEDAGENNKHCKCRCNRDRN